MKNNSGWSKHMNGNQYNWMIISLCCGQIRFACACVVVGGSQVTDGIQERVALSLAPVSNVTLFGILFTRSRCFRELLLQPTLNLLVANSPTPIAAAATLSLLNALKLISKSLVRVSFPLRATRSNVVLHSFLHHWRYTSRWFLRVCDEPFRCFAILLNFF